MSTTRLVAALCTLGVAMIVFFGWLILDPVRADRNSGLLAVYRTALRKWLQRLLRLVPKNERRHWYSAETRFYSEDANSEAADLLAADLWQFILNNPDWIRNSLVTVDMTNPAEAVLIITCDIRARSRWSADDELQDLLQAASLWEEW